MIGNSENVLVVNVIAKSKVLNVTFLFTWKVSFKTAFPGYQIAPE